MKRYLVVTPEVITYYTWEPPEYGADVVEVEAESKRDAIALGVKIMLDKDMKYVRNQKSDGCSPYTGVKAYENQEEP